MKRQWRIRRQPVEFPEGQQRWDRAYQYVLQWTMPPSQPTPPLAQEVDHECGGICTGVHATPGTSPDH